MKVLKAFSFCLALGCLGAASAIAQDRVPATPLITHDPYFSIWSTTDDLTASDTTHWTGKEQPIAGLARIDGKAYRFMGKEPGDVPAMRQTHHEITATHTRYAFEAGGVKLELAFFTPAIQSDLDLLSRPVTYLTWTASSTDSGSHQVAVLLDVDAVIAVNDRSQKVVSFRQETESLHVLSVGSQEQNVLNRSGDDLRIDWGYFHLAVPKSEEASLAIAPHARKSFIDDGKLPASDAMDMPERAGWGSPHLNAELNFGAVSSAAVTRHLLVSYTETFAIQYFERNLRPYWQRNHMPVEEMLDTAEKQYVDLDQRGAAMDAELKADLTKVGGEHYAELGILSYRQAITAHKLVADVNGNAFLFAKENFSNGCIGTVDVLYPSAPIFLFFQPKLLEALLRPVMEYSSLARWRFPFAPHDLGQYPLANGQVYGGGEKTEEDQMPVEETGNMVILI
ncbi:MAG TPA: DUF5127 domain-containing protein, partial [Acidobacteriaceae bacterium]